MYHRAIIHHGRILAYALSFMTISFTTTSIWAYVLRLLTKFNRIRTNNASIERIFLNYSFILIAFIFKNKIIYFYLN